MILSEYSDEDLIEEVIHRGLEVRVKIDCVSLKVFLGGEELGNIKAK